MRKTLAILLLTGTFLGSGCGSNNDFVITNTNNPQVSAPVCAADAYTTNANTTLTVPAATGVLANDTPNGATLTFPSTSAQGGTITGAQDGSFVYVPLSGFSGADSFSYTLGNSGGVVTCTVTITVNAVNGFFVDAATGSDTTGSFTGGKPYATIQAAEADAPAGSDIVVRPGSYTGTITLENGDRLLGSGSTLITPQGVSRPVLTGPVVLGDGNTLDFLRIAGTAGDAVDGDGQNGGTVTNCEIANTSGGAAGGVSGVGSSGTWVVSNNSFNSTAFFGTDFRGQGTSTLIVKLENNTMTNCGGAMGLISEGTSNVKALVKGNTFTNSAGVGAAFELTCGDDSTFCLDLEDNVNDDVYALTDSALGAAVLSVEQLSVLTTAKPAGAGNTGTVDITSGPTTEAPTEVPNGTCFP